MLARSLRSHESTSYVAVRTARATASSHRIATTSACRPSTAATGSAGQHRSSSVGQASAGAILKKELLPSADSCPVLGCAMSAATDGAMVRFDADSRAATVAKASPTVKLGELQAQILAAKATLKRAQLDKRNDRRGES